MIYLATTKKGLLELLGLLNVAQMTIWCGADALSEQEFAELQVDVTRFNYSLVGADVTCLKQALCTIEDHHPGESIWVEGTAS